MANLLPIQIKLAQRRNLFYRKLIIAGLAIGLFLVICLVLLFSFWANLFIREGGKGNFFLSASHETKEIDPLADSQFLMKKVKFEAELIDRHWSGSLISEMISWTISPRPARIKISGFSILRAEEGVNKISLIGVSNNRNDLVGYVNSLRQTQYFSKVDLPVESLISDKGGQFVINLEK